MMLDPITVLEATPIMAQAFGLKPDEDKPEVLSYLNKYRNLLYTLYNDFKLFDNVFHCICVDTFFQDCAGSCSSTYQAVTLPEDIAAVEAIWSYGRPLTLHSRWRETHTGLGVSGCSRVHSYEMAELFPTERDLTEFTSLKIFTERDEDDEKCLKVRIINEKGREQTVTFKLIAEGWAVSRIKAKKILSVSLPPERSGFIRLAQMDGRVLSEYAPWESIPAYRRHKLADNCPKGSVLIQGTKRFRPVFHDHDIVEVGNALVIEAAGNYFKFGDNTTEGKQIDRANADLQKMAKLLNGLIARHRGNNIQDGTIPNRRPVRNTTLPGYSR
jgi:hypothetical protein